METGEIKEHMEVVGSDGEHVGIVDHVEGDRIKLTRHDSGAMGEHHYLPLSAITSVTEFVTLTMTAADAKRQWHGES